MESSKNFHHTFEMDSHYEVNESAINFKQLFCNFTFNQNKLNSSFLVNLF